MPARLTPIRVADDVFEVAVESPAEAQGLASALRQTPGAEDVVAGLDRVAIKFDPAEIERVRASLKHVRPTDEYSRSEASPVEIAIRYGGEHGPDLEPVCAALGLSTDSFVAAHTGAVHTVEMIGFTPGFSYISGLPEGFSIPRLATPRPRVPAGSVGISAAFTGIYALDGPGGWPLIGRTDAELFRADRDAPFLLTPGQRVRFRAL